MSLISLKPRSLLRSVALSFVLCWSLCPAAFALERGKQLTNDRAVRAFGDALGESLFNQITNIRLNLSVVASTSVIVDRPEGTYQIDNLQVVDRVASATVSVFDPGGALQGEYEILSLTVPDENRIDYKTVVQTGDTNWVETGSMVGVSTAENTALQLVSIDGEDTSVNLLDFSGMTMDGQTASDSCPITTTPNGGGAASVGAVASACAVGAAIVVVVVAIVVCAIFCWLLFY